jgi:hypothetical protein
VPVREQNLDRARNIKVHEQETASVHVENTSLAVAPLAATSFLSEPVSAPASDVHHVSFSAIHASLITIRGLTGAADHVSFRDRCAREAGTGKPVFSTRGFLGADRHGHPDSSGLSRHSRTSSRCSAGTWVPPRKVRPVEVLDHQRVLDLRPELEQHDEVVAPPELRRPDEEMRGFDEALLGARGRSGASVWNEVTLEPMSQPLSLPPPSEASRRGPYPIPPALLFKGARSGLSYWGAAGSRTVTVVPRLTAEAICRFLRQLRCARAARGGRCAPRRSPGRASAKSNPTPSSAIVGATSSPLASVIIS